MRQPMGSEHPVFLSAFAEDHGLARGLHLKLCVKSCKYGSDFHGICRYHVETFLKGVPFMPEQPTTGFGHNGH